MGEEEVEFKNQKSLFKNVKKISVLNVAFSKSVLVLIKKWVYVPNSCLGFCVIFVTDESAFHSLVRAGWGGVILIVSGCPQVVTWEEEW